MLHADVLLLICIAPVLHCLALVATCPSERAVTDLTILITSHGRPV